MKNISFSATIPQFRARKKHVTRRGNAKGPTWKNLQPGNQLMGCEKCQGLGKGGKIVRMEPITVLEINTEPVDEIIRRPVRRVPEGIFPSARKGCRWYRCDDRRFCPQGCLSPQRYRVPDWQDLPCTSIGCPGICEMDLEGFPKMTPEEFVEMFCEMNNCEPETEITRILFDYVGRIT